MQYQFLETIDLDLISRAKGGDQAAIAELWTSFRPIVRSWANHSLGKVIRRVDGSDIAQNLYIDFEKFIVNFRGTTPQQLINALKTITSRLCQIEIVNHKIRMKRSVDREKTLDFGSNISEPLDTFASPDQNTASNVLHKKETAKRLEQALKVLPDQQREVVRLKYCKGMSFGEIAEHVGCSLQAALGRAKRGIHALRKKFDGQLGD